MPNGGIPDPNLEIDVAALTQALQRQQEILGSICRAPVFKGHGAFFCFFYTIAALAMIFIYAFFARFASDRKRREEYRCKLAQLIYRVNHCREGNDNPNIPLLT